MKSPGGFNTRGEACITAVNVTKLLPPRVQPYLREAVDENVSNAVWSQIGVVYLPLRRKVRRRLHDVCCFTPTDKGDA